MTKQTAFIFFGIILTGLVGSLVYFNTRGEVVEVTEVQPLANLPDGEMEKTPPAKPKGGASAKSESEKAKVAVEEKRAPEPGKVYASPEAAMKALSEAIGAKDFEAFVNFVGEESIAGPARPEVKAIVEAPELSLKADKPMTEISKSATAVRWALNFEPDTGDAGKQLYADLNVKGKTGFSIGKISLPLEVGKAASKEGAGTSPTPGGPAAPAIAAAEGADAVTIAHAFSKAVVGRNFKAARSLADPTTVTDERVAALMIAIEEGSFDLKEDRPLVVTLSRDDITWVLTRVQSGGASSEFALELGRVGDDWKVNGLTFSKVLAALSEQAGGGNVAYSPIVEDPMGGDSLVLYFEFDQATLSPRGNRQLAIIADILSQGAERVIRINGHADALGTDDYNSTLSDKRAAAIREGLISMGVAPSQVLTEAFGETKPRRPNFNPDGTDNPTGRSQNRRAEVYLDF
ncbi:MAG: OmpA family protein [Verrucomicrobiales bacterium]|nr:OmpA family protein [Verrucomicrobiales bacterium]